MQTFIRETLTNTGDNYIFPFFWIRSGQRDRIVQEIDAIQESGCRAFCVEARPHENFCRDEWWGDMTLILDEAKKRGMRVWLLDDKRFPTGYANGLVAEKYPERRKWQLIECHTDAIGPMKDASFLLNPACRDDILLGAYLYRRSGKGEEITGNPIDVTDRIKGNFLYTDIPEGCWRLFFCYKSRKGTGQKDYIHLIDEESVKVQIEAVYESHFEHFHEYFGNTFAGFFSDEPSLGNTFFNGSVPNPGSKNLQIGQVGLALPWSDRLSDILKETCGENPLPFLPTLWYPHPDTAKDLRFLYMDTVTGLYRDAFSRQIGDWCRAHGVQYIGHIIEDMNAHGRLGCSTGHYFRSMDGQDMSGMDIVLHQILPGFGEYPNSASMSTGVADPDFYHYSLAQMCASMAELNPHMRKNSMCEVFGANGWAEGTPMMKWLIDHLLVRGINHFVPHAFSMTYPDPDCPPHFYAGGNNPQYEGFRKLMHYTNRAAHLFAGSTSSAHTAVLYHAESEWANGIGDDAMLMQVPGKCLTDAHIPFEYLPADYIRDFGNMDGHCLTVHDVQFDCLLVPYARSLPSAVWQVLEPLCRSGFPVYMVTDRYTETDRPLPTVSLKDLPSLLSGLGISAIPVNPAEPLLRISRRTHSNARLYMLFNESMHPMEHLRVTLPDRGTYLIADLLDGNIFSGATEDGIVRCSLTPYQSVILIFDEDLPVYPPLPAWEDDDSVTAPASWAVSLKESGISDGFRPLKTMMSPENISKLCPDFSGVIRYEGTFTRQGTGACAVDFGEVGETAHLWVNGQDCGMSICRPYRFTITDAVRPGENHIRVEVANTLTNRVKDPFSFFIALPASGLMGPVRFLRHD